MWLFLKIPQVFLQFVIVVFPDHTHYFWVMKFPLIFAILILRVYSAGLSMKNRFITLRPEHQRRKP